MTDKSDSGPAFPFEEEWRSSSGMSLRQYAAIKLRVPDSGLPWLDEMIEKSRRDDVIEKIAAIYMQDVPCGYEEKAVGHVLHIADAMLIARSK